MPAFNEKLGPHGEVWAGQSYVVVLYLIGDMQSVVIGWNESIFPFQINETRYFHLCTNWIFHSK